MAERPLSASTPEVVVAVARGVMAAQPHTLVALEAEGPSLLERVSTEISAEPVVCSAGALVVTQVTTEMMVPKDLARVVAAEEEASQ